MNQKLRECFLYLLSINANPRAASADSIFFDFENTKLVLSVDKQEHYIRIVYASFYTLEQTELYKALAAINKVNQMVLIQRVVIFNNEDVCSVVDQYISNLDDDLGDFIDSAALLLGKASELFLIEMIQS